MCRAPAPSGKLPYRRRRLKEERIRQIRLQRSREAERLARKGKVYDPDRWPFVNLDSTKPMINHHFRPTKPSQHVIRTIRTPEHLDLRSHITSTLQFIHELRKQWLYGSSTKLRIDQSALQAVSPGAASLWIAEMQRCMEYQSGRKRVTGNYPRNPEARRTLAEVGFYRVLSIHPPETDPSSELFFRIVHGTQSDARITNRLIANFEKEYKFDVIARRRLTAALIECMDNVKQHAYDRNSGSPDLYERWWLSGYFDSQTGLVTIVFLDQGLGIPTTLRRRENSSIREKIRERTQMGEVKLLEEAVVHGATRLGSDRRGTGLPSLKDFIDEIAPDGHLRVLSNSAEFRYKKDRTYSSAPLETPLNGSLILWSIKDKPSQLSATDASRPRGNHHD